MRRQHPIREDGLGPALLLVVVLTRPNEVAQRNSLCHYRAKRRELIEIQPFHDLRVLGAETLIVLSHPGMWGTVGRPPGVWCAGGPVRSLRWSN